MIPNKLPKVNPCLLPRDQSIVSTSRAIEGRLQRDTGWLLTYHYFSGLDLHPQSSPKQSGSLDKSRGKEGNLKMEGKKKIKKEVENREKGKKKLEA